MMVKKKESEDKRIEKGKEYIKKNLLKQVLKQKVYELGIIPLCIVFIYYIPYWIGLIVIKITGEDWYLSCIVIAQEIMTRGDFWFVGIFITIMLGLFIWFNIVIAEIKLRGKASEKFDVCISDLW